MTATLTQASLAYNDEHLVNRIRQAVSIHKKCFVDEMVILEIIASTPIGDNATIASAYEYHWVSMLQSLGEGRASLPRRSGRGHEFGWQEPSGHHGQHDRRGR